MSILTSSLFPTVASGPTGITTSFFSTLTSQRQVRKTRKALEALSDTELTDIGLTRGDIPMAAEGRFKR